MPCDTKTTDYDNKTKHDKIKPFHDNTCEKFEVKGTTSLAVNIRGINRAMQTSGHAMANLPVSAHVGKHNYKINDGFRL
jgi:hypothetical protein